MANNMTIFNGTYMNILPDIQCGYNVFGNAYIMHNGDDSPLYTTTYINSDGLYFERDNKLDLITYEKFRNIGYYFRSTYPSKLPKLLHYDDTNYIHKNYSIKKYRYRDYNRKKELLIENCQNLCKEMETKYFIIKEFFLQNFGHVEVFLLREIFDIKHYLTILLAYNEEIDKYSFDIEVYLFDSKDLLKLHNLQTCENDEDDVDLLDLNEAYHGYLKEYEQKRDGTWEIQERFFERIP
jgi:hypothetical protein